MSSHFSQPFKSWVSVCICINVYIPTKWLYSEIMQKNEGLTDDTETTDYLAVLVVCQNNLLIKTNIIATLLT